jgi:streptomycin 6-kinase
MNLPPEFISTIQNTFGDEGHTFLKALPESIAEASSQWNLTDVQPVPALSYNFVAFAKRFPSPSQASPLGGSGRGGRGEGENVVLKMAVPNREFRSEMAALKLFNGEGACRVLECDEEKYWMLLERLNPGVMLATLEDDEEATRIAAEVMKRIWSPLDNVTLSGAKGLPDDGKDPSLALRMTDTSKFIQLTDWFDGLKRLRNMFNGGTGPLNAKLVERVESSVKGFFAEDHHPVLMHGDFHHFNVLSSERGWLIIDPKGVIGPAGYEVGPLLMNPWGDLLNGTNYRRMTKRRIDILHEHLGFERERIREWGLAHAILSAWWGIEDNTGWEYSMAFAEMMAELEI